jgi:glycosyltransferase involved in cell wall biosynthesis
MKIAIVAPSPIPFTIGGAENLYWGLQNYINENTKHQCELIKLPSPESNLEELINSYERFSLLNLDSFDCVISTKYPSWMIHHRNHVCYLLHRLRGLYDTYHFTGQPIEVPWTLDEMVKAKTLSEQLIRLGASNLASSFDLCREFLLGGGNGPAVDFPGPFSRWLIHHFDSIGMDLARISKYAAISNVVKNREGYFPKGAPVTVLYPPPRLSGFYCGSDDYLFTVSRLDGPKRIRLLIEAMKFVRSDIPLLIAGTGPDEVEIKKMAAGDQRIQFLGFVNDKDLIDYYANALAILFIPYDEDYGLITIEAMKSSKPVITFTDSGGSNEFVKNGINGFSVDPNPIALAEKIDYLSLNRGEAREMGVSARSSVDHINWDYVVNGLLSLNQPNKIILIPGEPSPKKKMVVAVTFPIYPPRGGGQARIYNLYKNLTQQYDIEIHSLCGHDQQKFDGFIAPGLREIRTPISLEHQLAEHALSQSVEWVPVTDIVMPKLIPLTPAYLRGLKESVKYADVIIASHPYLGKELHQMSKTAEFWFEAHNIELSLKKNMLPDSESSKELLDLVSAAERYCWKNAKLVFACTNQDLLMLEDVYGETEALKIEVPNGTCPDDVPFIDGAERNRRKELLGYGNNTVTLFMGSWHGPNIEAAKKIIEFAKRLPDVVFIIVGSVCGAISNIPITQNVKLVGVVEDNEKAILLGTADIALNPMEKGSGSNLKVLDYFSAGIPIVSTKFGMRGMKAERNLHYREVEIEEFFAEINDTKPSEDFKGMVLSARALVLENYDWSRISSNFIRQLKVIEQGRKL